MAAGDFSISPRSSTLLPIFYLSRNLSMQALKSSHQRNTVQRQGVVTMGSKPTTTAGEHYYFFITFLDIRNQTCFTIKCHM